MSVGPTVLRAIIGTGAPARVASSKNTNCSSTERPWPPYSVGQPTPSQPSAPIFWRTSREVGPPWPSAAMRLADVGREQLGEVGAQLVAELVLRRGVVEVQGGSRSRTCSSAE